MTVAELIKKLQEMPQDVEVLMPGGIPFPITDVEKVVLTGPLNYCIEAVKIV